jgi:molybdenum cofactor cytidylyltransferase
MDPVEDKGVAAIVVAAGLSTRMGRPKPLLQYGDHTVIEQIVSVLESSPLDDLVVVTGHERQAVEDRLAAWATRTVFNPRYREGEMLSSVQCGLAALESNTDAALIALCDQPQIQAVVVHAIVEAYRAGQGALIIPSFEMRRGHPILIGRRYWPEVLALHADETLRSVINGHAEEIAYVEVDTDSVVRDMDTPADYRRELRRLGQRDNSS